MDSTALTFLLRLARDSSPARVQLCNPSPQVEYLLTTNGADGVFDLTRDQPAT